MPNRLTRVPARPLPPPRPGTRLIYLAADSFMLLMLSRPASGSLRSTWVTPGTVLLGATTGALGCVAAFVLGIRAVAARNLVEGGAAVALAILALGALCVVRVAALQRQSRRE